MAGGFGRSRWPAARRLPAWSVCTGSEGSCPVRRPWRWNGGCTPTTGDMGTPRRPPRASLRFGFDEAGLAEIVAFTTTLNTRSQAVMARIGMVRDPGADFDHPRIPEGSPLRRHVFYRVSPSQVAPSVAP